MVPSFQGEKKAEREGRESSNCYEGNGGVSQPSEGGTLTSKLHLLSDVEESEGRGETQRARRQKMDPAGHSRNCSRPAHGLGLLREGDGFRFSKSPVQSGQASPPAGMDHTQRALHVAGNGTLPLEVCLAGQAVCSSSPVPAFSSSPRSPGKPPRQLVSVSRRLALFTHQIEMS